MRTPKTVTIKPKGKKAIDFYLKDDKGNKYYLFTQKYSEHVRLYFGEGVNWNNLKNGFKRRSFWLNGQRASKKTWYDKSLERIMDKIQKQAKYVLTYEAV